VSGSCTLISGKGDASEPMPTEADLKAALVNGRRWLRNWYYECGGVLATVSFMKYPLNSPEEARGFYMIVSFKLSREQEPDVKTSSGGNVAR